MYPTSALQTQPTKNWVTSWCWKSSHVTCTCELAPNQNLYSKDASLNSSSVWIQKLISDKLLSCTLSPKDNIGCRISFSFFLFNISMVCEWFFHTHKTVSHFEEKNKLLLSNHCLLKQDLMQTRFSGTATVRHKRQRKKKKACLKAPPSFPPENSGPQFPFRLFNAKGKRHSTHAWVFSWLLLCLFPGLTEELEQVMG